MQQPDNPDFSHKGAAAKMVLNRTPTFGAGGRRARWITLAIPLLLPFTLPGKNVRPQDIMATCSSKKSPCPLRPHTFTAALNEYVALKNRTDRPIRVDQIRGSGGPDSGFHEYCAYLNVFETYQPSPGQGEVGCTSRDAFETYPTIRWDTSADVSGLTVLPGSTLYLSHGPAPQRSRFTFEVVTSGQGAGVNAWRQPQVDESISCSGKRQQTVWKPWRNSTGADLIIRGALIYAVSGKPDPARVDAGCLNILGADRSVIATRCTNLNKRGRAAIQPALRVRPNQSVAAQASHTCMAPAKWDWAAYIYVSPA